MSMSRRNNRYSYGRAARDVVNVAKSYMAYDPTLKHLRSAYNYRNKVQNTAPAEPLRGRPAKRKKKTYKRKTKAKKERDRCKKAIKDLNQKADASLGTMTYRKIEGQSSISGPNLQQAFSADIIRKTELEAVLTQLKFFDPSNPETLIVSNGASGSYSRDYLFKTITQKLTVRNNFISDCRVKVYYCTNREDTDLTPIQAWVAGLPDGSNMTQVTSLLNYPNDHALFRDLWKTKVVLDTTLSPGQTAKMSNTVKDVHYNPAVFDSQIEEYQTDIKSGGYLVVYSGTSCHGSGFKAGLIPAGLDAIAENTYVVEYQAGVNIKYVHAVNGLLTMTNPIQSHQPVADNQAFDNA